MDYDVIDFKAVLGNGLPNRNGRGSGRIILGLRTAAVVSGKDKMDSTGFAFGTTD